MVAAVVVAAAVGIVVGSTSSGRRSAPIYLALGDSIAFGYRPAGSVPAPDYHDPSSFVGYPELVGAARRLQVVNASCPGETVSSLVSATAPSHGCENEAGKGTGYRTRYPLHVAYRGSQLAFAVGYLRAHRRAVRLVTITIGINDVALCLAYTGDDCRSASDQRALLAEVRGGLTTLFADLRGEDRYRGPIVAVTMYATSYTDPALDHLVSIVDATVAGIVRHDGGTVADGYAAFQTASAHHGGSPCAAGLLVALPGGQCDLHPSPAGQRLLASAVEAATPS